MVTRGNVNVAYGQFWVDSVERTDVTGYSYAGDNGLVVALVAPGAPAVPGHHAVIYATDYWGNVPVSLDVGPEPPPLQVDDWDDVAEVSLRLQGGGVVNGFDFPAAGLPPLPEGDVRLRVHVRGRDQDAEEAETTLALEYLLQIWPAAPAPPLDLKLTDQTGAHLRATPAQPNPQPQAAPDDDWDDWDSDDADDVESETLTEAARSEERRVTPHPDASSRVVGWD